MTTAYALLVLAVALERLAELGVSARNARWSFARGGRETGQRHYLAMVAVQVAWLGGCLAEPVLADRPFRPALGWTMVALVVVGQALRWWCVASLGRRWNTRVIVVRGMRLSTRGPYRWLRHPNYLAVMVEGVALPLVHSAWIIAAAFVAAQVPLLAVRIHTEEAALRWASGSRSA